MVQEYFPNRDNECYNSALSNLLIEKGDRLTAEKFFHTYRSHPLVTPDGRVFAGIITKVLSELTGGKYEGTFHFNFMDNWKELAQKYFGGLSEKLVKITLEEMTIGRIKNHTGIINYKSPSLLLVQREIGHYIVDVGDGSFIDNGQCFNYPKDSLNVAGVLEINKSF